MHLCSTVVVVVHVTRADTGFLPTLPLFLDDVKLGVYYDNTLYQAYILVHFNWFDLGFRPDGSTYITIWRLAFYLIQTSRRLKEDRKKTKRRQEEDQKKIGRRPKEDRKKTEKDWKKTRRRPE